MFKTFLEEVQLESEPVIYTKLRASACCPPEKNLGICVTKRTPNPLHRIGHVLSTPSAATQHVNVSVVSRVAKPS